VSEDTELEAQLRADPDDVAAHLVYADLLQTQGDPYGELIVLQHELAANPTKAIAKRERAWFERNYFEVPEYYKLVWRLGFVRAATLHAKVGYLHHAVEFLKSPAFRFLRTLRIEGSARGAFAMADELPDDLDELAIRTREDIDSATLTAVVATLPKLRKLQVITRRTFEGAIAVASPVLTELVLGSEHYYETIEVAMKTPALTSLVISAPGLAKKSLEAVLDRRWPLERLGLFVADEPALDQRLPNTNVWPGLKAIGLEWDDAKIDEPRDFKPVLERMGARELILNPLWDGTRLYQVGQALRDCDRFADAMRCFELGIAELPGDADMWLEHGNVSDDLGRTADAGASWRRGLKVDPDHVGCLNNLARWYRDAKEPATGLPLVVKACKLAPDDGDVWALRGQLELRTGKPGAKSLQRALKIYWARVADNAADADALFQIACVNCLLGERATCLDMLGKAIATDAKIKQRAKTDIDLESLRADPDFLRLVS
jgi:uncharacterized protein (TIGR02996 family)